MFTSMLQYSHQCTLHYSAEDSRVITSTFKACMHASLTKGELFAAVCIGLNAGKLLTRFIFFLSFDAPNHNTKQQCNKASVGNIFSSWATEECEAITHEPSDGALFPSKQKIRSNIPFSSFTVCAGSLAGECRWPRDMRVRENDFLSIMSEDFTLWVIWADRASVLQGQRWTVGGREGG